MKMYPIQNCEMCPASGNWKAVKILAEKKDFEEFYCNRLGRILTLQYPFVIHPDCRLEDWPEIKRG